MATPFSLTTRALDADHGHRAWAVWLLCGLLMGAWLVWFLCAEVAVREVSRQARIEVMRSAHPMASAVAGSVLANHMVLGQTVHRGDVLLVLDASAETLQLQEAQARMAALQPRMQSLQKEMDALALAQRDDHQGAQAQDQAAEARLRDAASAAEQARDQAWRTNEQARSGFVSEAATRRASSDASRMSAVRDAVSAERRRLRSEAASRRHEQSAHLEALQRELLTLQGEAMTLAATQARLQRDIALRTVRAPVDGVVGDLSPLPPGSYVAEGRAVATIVPPGQLRIVGQFPPSAALGRVREGQSASMRLDGFAWTQFGDAPATVVSVGKEIHDGLVRVELSPAKADTRLPLQHGLPGTVDIVIERCSPATLLLRTVAQWTQTGAAS
jgi:adhesin transport system membrane fusion protein